MCFMSSGFCILRNTNQAVLGLVHLSITKIKSVELLMLYIVFAVLQESRLPSIVETKGDDLDDSFHLSPATRSRRNLLLPSFSSPVRRTSLGNLLGDELRQFNALRRCRSPNLSRGLHGQSSSPQAPSKKEHSTPTTTPASTSAQGESGAEQKPTKLLIPTVTCFGPPDLSPRYCESYHQIQNQKTNKNLSKSKLNEFFNVGSWFG